MDVLEEQALAEGRSIMHLLLLERTAHDPSNTTFTTAHTTILEGQGEKESIFTSYKDFYSPIQSPQGLISGVSELPTAQFPAMLSTYCSAGNNRQRWALKWKILVIIFL